MPADPAMQSLLDAAASLREEGVAQGLAQAQQAYFGQSAIRLLMGIFAVSLQEAASMIARYSPDAQAFLGAKAAEFAEFANPPTVTSVSPATDAADVAADDGIVLGFSAPLDPETVTADCVYVAPTSGGSALSGDLQYDGAQTVTLTPTNGFTPGVAYTITVKAAVRSRVGQTMGSDWTSAFTAASA